jgi:hypothetical protein
METQYYCYGCHINTTDFPVVKVYVTDFPVLKVHVAELLSARICFRYCLTQSYIKCCDNNHVDQEFLLN